MGATVEQDEIDGMFYLTIMIFKLIARCYSGIGENLLCPGCHSGTSKQSLKM